MGSEDTKTNPGNHNTDQGISRRTAIRKMGYAAFASSTMLLLLNNPTKAQVASPSNENPGDPAGDWDFGGKNNDSNKSDNRDYGNYDWD